MPHVRKTQMGAWVRWGHSIERNMILKNLLVCHTNHANRRHASLDDTITMTPQNNTLKTMNRRPTPGSTSMTPCEACLRKPAVSVSAMAGSTAPRKPQGFAPNVFCPLLFGTVPASCKRGFFSRSSKEGGVETARLLHLGGGWGAGKGSQI